MNRSIKCSPLLFDVCIGAINSYKHSRGSTSLPIFLSLQWAITCIPVGINEHNPQVDITVYEVYAFLIPILIVLTFLPSFKYLAYAAYVGFVFLVIAMIVSLGGGDRV